MEKEELLLSFGKRVQKLRSQAKLTQRELAEAASVSAEHISRIERGVTRCRIETAYAMSESLRVPFHHLFLFESSAHSSDKKQYLEHITEELAQKDTGTLKRVSNNLQSLLAFMQEG